jgi:hypothetical protein
MPLKVDLSVERICSSLSFSSVYVGGRRYIFSLLQLVQ